MFHGIVSKSIIFMEELPERIKINRAWEKDSRLPSPILEFNRD
jgi:hypothetical protein